MKEQKFEEEKPRRWLLVVLIIIAIIISVVLINKYVMDKKADKKEHSSIFDIFTDTKSKINVNSFNSKFEMYVGTEYGSSVSRLLDEVITNNKKNKDYVVTVIYGDTKTSDAVEIKNLKKQFDTWDKLEVSLDYDDEGYINLVTIEDYEIKETSDNNVVSNIINNSSSDTFEVGGNTTDDFDKMSFNSYATFHSGTKSGFFVKSMIDYVVNNNSSNNAHQLFVEYNGTKASDSDGLKSLKNKFSDFTDYEVSVSYDTDGYASGFNVK